MKNFYLVKFDTNESLLTCLVKRGDGKIRIITVKEHQKETTKLPPKDWALQVTGEIAFQEQEELAAQLGRKLPGY